MKTAFDTDSILFALLDGKMSNKGGVYVGDDRPEDSTDEDVVVNTIDLPQDCLPQNGTSNINIYTADTTKKIKGKMQVSANRSRLKVLADEALTIIRNANIKGLKIDRKSTRLNSSHANISYAVFCLKKKKIQLISK